MKVARGIVRCRGMLCMIPFGFRRKATAAAALSPAQACSLEPNMSSRHGQVHPTDDMLPADICNTPDYFSS